MKKIVSVLAAILFLTACEDLSCGGWHYEDIFINTSDGLVDIHGQVLTYPYYAVSEEIEIVSYGIYSNEDVYVLQDVDGITIGTGEGFPPSEENAHPKKKWFHVQSLHISFTPNLSREDRVMKVRVQAGHETAAEFTIVQEARMN